MLALAFSNLGSGRILALGSHPCQMHFSCCGATSLFAPATWAAQNCHGPHVAFGTLVPPLLLSFGPHLRGAAGLAAERHGDVVPAFDEVRGAVAVGRAKVVRIDENVSLREFSLGAR